MSLVDFHNMQSFYHAAPNDYGFPIHFFTIEFDHFTPHQIIFVHNPSFSQYRNSHTYRTNIFMISMVPLMLFIGHCENKIHTYHEEKYNAETTFPG